MEAWVRLADGTQSVVAAGRNIGRADPKTRSIIEAIMQGVRNGVEYQPLIVVQAEDGSLILVEGYARATAYAAVAVSEPIDLFVGFSPNIHRWYWY